MLEMRPFQNIIMELIGNRAELSAEQVPLLIFVSNEITGINFLAELCLVHSSFQLR